MTAPGFRDEFAIANERNRDVVMDAEMGQAVDEDLIVDLIRDAEHGGYERTVDARQAARSIMAAINAERYVRSSAREEIWRTCETCPGFYDLNGVLHVCTEIKSHPPHELA